MYSNRTEMLNKKCAKNPLNSIELESLLHNTGLCVCVRLFLCMCMCTFLLVSVCLHFCKYPVSVRVCVCLRSSVSVCIFVWDCLLFCRWRLVIRPHSLPNRSASSVTHAVLITVRGNDRTFTHTHTHTPKTFYIFPMPRRTPKTSWWTFSARATRAPTPICDTPHVL